MLIVYLSLTGNVRNFVEKLEVNSIEIEYSNPLVEVNEDYIIIVPTYDDNITNSISEFVDYANNQIQLKGFVGSGNKNFDNGYCFNAKDLSIKYNKPLLFTFEFSGTDEEITQFKKEVLQI
jgi:protein involved in ribonucleotide reduction